MNIDNEARVLLGSFLDKSSKDLKCTEFKEESTLMVRSRLSETKEAEAVTERAGNREVDGPEFAVQIAVISTINFRPRVCGLIV